MKKRKASKPGHGKLLDAWTPPDGAGHPVGCVATSFTFSPVFFEEECLGRFLQMETDPVEDGPMYLIEREEKLAQVSCIAAIVDQHHCRGLRSLRWDLLPCRPIRGILHAKVMLLRWNNLIRLIVGSANLTEDGYRRNREVFGVLDYGPQAEAPTAVLQQMVELLRGLASDGTSGQGEVGSPVQQRIDSFLDGVEGTTRDWEIQELPSRSAVQVVPILVAPGQPDVFEQVSQVWPPGPPPHFANVVSPFFDPPEAENLPAQQLWLRLRRRGDATVEYHVTTEEVPGEDAIFVHAPKSLITATPHGRPGTQTLLARLEPDANRPLHAKSIWLENDRWLAYLVGSSNFTSAGLGLAKNPNTEANLLYLVDCHRSEKTYRQYEKCCLPAEALSLDDDLRWQPRVDRDEDEASDEMVLPHAFDLALYDLASSGRGQITLTFKGAPPRGWSVCHEDEDRVIYTEADWTRDQSPQQVTVGWREDRPPSAFRVRWTDSSGTAWWPVNVVRSAALPPPEQLRDLPLDTLVDILTSARPVYRILAEHLKRKRIHKDGSGVETDPHKRVDTSQFLLQRTRRVSWALTALRERLERPVVTKEALHWRLRGPIGVTAVADALLREAGAPEESAFLLAELVLELHRVKPASALGALPPQVVTHEINTVIQELCNRSARIEDPALQNMRQYVERVFATVSS